MTRIQVLISDEVGKPFKEKYKRREAEMIEQLIKDHIGSNLSELKIEQSELILEREKIDQRLNQIEPEIEIEESKEREKLCEIMVKYKKNYGTQPPALPPDEINIFLKYRGVIRKNQWVIEHWGEY